MNMVTYSVTPVRPTMVGNGHPFGDGHAREEPASSEALAAGGLVTQDGYMQWLVYVALRVAKSDVVVLITGETGTGKEILARLIHGSAQRASHPFLAQNCSAIPATLIESELFGHQRGAFTGATQDRRGVFELAEHGTLFLDEIGEMPMEAQSKLLRVFEEGKVWPVGADRPRPVRARIIAATNRDLEAEICAGRFRQDLYYRLSVFPLGVPPLRHRRRDIPLLVEHFVQEGSRRAGRPSPAVSPEVLSMLMEYDFPGNIRELQNLVARALILVDDGGSVLRSEHFPGLRRPLTGRLGTYREQVRRFETQLLIDALQRDGSQTAAAKSLGMSPRNFNRLRRRLMISEPKVSDRMTDRGRSPRRLSAHDVMSSPRLDRVDGRDETAVDALSPAGA
ncbi:MAG: sigma-54 interaction domain-containing protein [Gammaproteobacteria bacterium]